MSQRWSAQGLIDLVLDDGSFESWDQPIDISGHSDVLPGRAAGGGRARGHRRVGAHRPRAGARSSGRRRGQRVRLPRRLDRRGRRRSGSWRAYAARPPRACPLLATTASGGTRMQEGTPAFFEMVAISRAVMAHRAAGLPYLVHLRHPTTGGVYASWGSLGHVTVAEPGALVGFLGPEGLRGARGAAVPVAACSRPRTSPRRA